MTERKDRTWVRDTEDGLSVHYREDKSGNIHYRAVRIFIDLDDYSDFPLLRTETVYRGLLPVSDMRELQAEALLSGNEAVLNPVTEALEIIANIQSFDKSE